MDSSETPLESQGKTEPREGGPKTTQVDVENHPFDAGLAQSIGPRYEGRGVLGEGGMGEVRLYFDERMGREVAMKVLLPRCAESTELRARFEREALVQGQLEHPAIVPVYEKGKTSAGLPWFTMKRIHGETLDAILTRLAAGHEEAARQYPRHRLLRAFAQVCRAVDLAHSRGVVHCDLKPSNLMVGDYGEVYVLDWGLAQSAGASANLSRSSEIVLAALPNLTGGGRVLGTPGYVAPEQARPEAAVRPSGDAYSLGAILFEILMLERLVARGDAATQLREARHGTHAMARLAERRDEIPSDLAAICGEAVRRTVRARPSAGALADAIELYLAGDERAEERAFHAAEHVERARNALAAARQKDDAMGTKHREAIHETIRALRLDANNIAAAETLAGLLIDPPGQLPLEARQTLEAETGHRLKDALASSAWGRLSWLLYVPVMVWAGLRSWLLLSALLGSAAFGATAQLWARRRPTRGRVDLASVLMVLTIAPTAMVLGPLWITPLVVMASIPTLIAVADARRTQLTVAAGAVTICIPSMMEWTGYLPDTYTFRDGVLVVQSQMMNLEPTTMHLLVLVMSLGALFTSSILVSRTRLLFMRSTRRHHLELWQLAQLIPGIRAADIGRGKPRKAPQRPTARQDAPLGPRSPSA